MERKFVKYRKRTWLQRHNPFNRMIANRLPFILGAPASPKKHFDVQDCNDQGDTEECFEYQSVQIQQAVDGNTYDVQALLQGVCSYLGVSPANYAGTDVQTGAAAMISPGLTKAGTGETLAFDAILWISADKGMDFYDTVQSFIEQYQRPVGVAVDWMNDWDTGNGCVPNSALNPLGGHFVGLYGKVTPGYLGVNFPEEDRMDLANTWGNDAPGSAQGHYLFSREEINQYFQAYGAFIPISSNDRTVKILGKLSQLYVKLIDLINFSKTTNQ